MTLALPLPGVVDTTLLWPPPDEGGGWAHWIVIAERLGAASPPQRPLLLGTRGVRLFEEKSHEPVARAAYDDTFVLIQHQPQDGVRFTPPAMFPGSTHAYQTRSKASPDVNRDGEGDVGTIKPGDFCMTLRYDGAYPFFVIFDRSGNENLPCFRDLNHDGKWEDGPYTANSILFHIGYDAPDDSHHRSSIGCQTARLPWLQLMASCAKDAGGKIDYMLRNVQDVLLVVPDTIRPPAENA